MSKNEIEALKEELERCKARLEEMADARSNELLLNQRLESEIAARTRMESALKESEEKYRRLIENANEAIFSVNRKGEFTFANKYAAQWVGLPQDKVVGMTMWDLFPAELAEPQVQGLLRVMNSGKGVLQEAKTVRDGKIAWVMINIQPIFAGKDEAESVLCFAMDITERKVAEENMRKAKEEAERANKLKSEFLANMSHEIRTPLNAIIGFTDVLLEEEKDPEDSEKLTIIKDSGQSLLAIINDILDFSKIEANKLVIDQTVFSVRNVVDHFKNIFDESAKAKGLEFVISLGEGIPELVQGDEQRLGQILMNLLSNAFKFTEEGKVELRCEYEAERLVIAVLDTGMGIPPEKQADIFKPFEQADSSSVRRFGGTGLGLAICSRLAGLMGGEIAFNSRPRGGSEFTVRLPFSPAKEGRGEEVEERDGMAPGEIDNSLRILLAEDNVVNQKVVRAFLEKGGIGCDLSENGEEALRMIEEGRYDILLLDMQMPVKSGEEVIKELRSQKRFDSLRVIALTAHALEGDEERYLSMGCDGYLSKPIDKTLLLSTIKSFAPGDSGGEEKFQLSTGEEETVRRLIPVLRENLHIFNQTKLEKTAAEIRSTGPAEAIMKIAADIERAAAEFDEEGLRHILSRAEALLSTK